MKIDDVMTRSVVTVNPTTDYKEIVELLLAWNVSGLPVVDFDGQPVGVVTEADLLLREGYPHGPPRALAVLADVISGPEHQWLLKADGLTAGELMTSALVTCAPCDEVNNVARRMLNRGVKRMPVVEDGKLVGIVSRRDLLATFDRPDGEIAKDINRMLSERRFRAEHTHMSAQVKDGMVILSGHVRRPSDAQLIVSLVRRVRGVIDVVNRLQWREREPESVND